MKRSESVKTRPKTKRRSKPLSCSEKGCKREALFEVELNGVTSYMCRGHAADALGTLSQ